MPSYLRAILRSYGMLFFSQHGGLAGVLLLVTFSHPVAGAAGLLSAALAVGAARLGGFNREWTDGGAYGFNSLLVGLALGSWFAPGWELAGLVVAGAGLALLLSVALGGWLGGRGLPFLSLPFVLTTWFLLLVSGQLPHLLPAEQEQSASWLASLSGWPWPPLLAAYLRALGAVLFQDSALAGLLVAGGLLWHSRIAFSLSVLAFLGAYGLGLLTGPAGGGLSEDNLGANYLVAALAVGGVFCIPSRASYGWALLSVPLTVGLVVGLTAGLARLGLGLSVLSLPYCGAALLLLGVLRQRERPGVGPVLTPVQHYSPERNLYAHAISHEQLPPPGAVALTLPFLGEWRCTQGYNDGPSPTHGPTHLGDWGQALDFVIADADGYTYQGTGLALSDYYAYDKPVLAPADGVVEEVVQHLDDNAIGEVNLVQNWGNTVVLRHAPGLYTQLSHLRSHSVPVRPGDQVRRGDLLGACGSSGRSPEPHLHFQVQATPYVGSRTLAYPLAYFMARPAAGPAVAPGPMLVNQQGALARQTDGAKHRETEVITEAARLTPVAELRHFAVPRAGETISLPALSRTLSQALRLPPGYALRVQDAAAPHAPAQRWEVLTDAYNLTYLRCQATGAVLYFASDEARFACTAFYGPPDCWLHYFYQAAYRVPLASLPEQLTRDVLPLSALRPSPLTWAQDLLAPFYQFLKLNFSLEWAAGPAAAWPGSPVRLRSRVAVAGCGRERLVQTAELVFCEGALAELVVRRAGRTLRLTCSVVSG